MRSCVIIGGGQAAAQTALSARKAGYAGPITIVGAEQYEPYERPTLSKETLRDGTPPVYAAPAGAYLAQDITLKLGVAAQRLDLERRQVRLADGTDSGFDDLVLATGGRPRRPDVPGADHIRLLRTLDDAESLRAQLARAPRVVLIGGGVIGLELAATAREFGCEVTVIEMATRLMSRSLPEPASRLLAQIHAAAGVRLLLEQGIAAIRATAAGAFEVELADGAAVPADLVVAGVGIERALDLAKEAGIAASTGILVDFYGRTSAPDVFAAGDVTELVSDAAGHGRLLETWQNAQNQGRRVGQALAGQFDPSQEAPWFWSDQHGTNIQVLGQCIGEGRLLWRGAPDSGQCSLFRLDEAGRVAGVVAFNSPRDIAAARRLIAGGYSVNPDVLANASIVGPALLRACTAEMAPSR